MTETKIVSIIDDDSRVVAKMAAKLWLREKAEVTTFSTREEVHGYKYHGEDVVYLDGNLYDDISGLDILAKIPDVEKVVCISNDEFMIDDFKRAGVTQFAEK